MGNVSKEVSVIRMKFGDVSVVLIENLNIVCLRNMSVAKNKKDNE